MKEITRLSITRKQLEEQHFYYNGCECSNTTEKEAEAANDSILSLAADVLIDILKNEYKEED